MAANIINATTAGVITTGGDEPILNLQTAGVTRLSITSPQVLSPAVFWRENSQTVTGDYSITTGRNAMSAGPITVNTGATVTIPDGSAWTIV